MSPTLDSDLGLAKCQHSSAGREGDMVLAMIGNTLRGDDGVAQSVCRALPQSAVAGVCQFDLGTYANFLSLCLAGHKTAIIVDAVSARTAPGNSSVIDLTAVNDACAVPAIDSTHGISFVHELQIASRNGCLPDKVFLFGIEVRDTTWRESLSEEVRLKVPELAAQLADIICRLRPQSDPGRVSM